jgi:hypothetical protein
MVVSSDGAPGDAGDIAAAVEATRKGYAPAAAQQREEAVARLIQRHAKSANAAAELAQATKAFPNSATICIANAFWLSDQGRFQEALVEYDRCSAMEGQSMEQALYIGAQRAAINAYAKRSESGKPRLKKAARRE